MLIAIQTWKFNFLSENPPLELFASEILEGVPLKKFKFERKPVAWQAIV